MYTWDDANDVNTERLFGGKVDSILAKQYFNSGNVLNSESGGLAWSHNNGFPNRLAFQNAHNF